MHVISRAGLMKLAKKHPDATEPLVAWYRIARKSPWNGLHDVRRTFPAADQVGNVLIFNLLGNHYRLIATVNYRVRRMYLKALLTHAEYNRKEWMKWA